MEVSTGAQKLEYEGDNEVGDGLLARTRRSMAGFEAAQLRAQLQRRRSQRKVKQAKAPAEPGAGRRGDGFFPAVDEEEGDATLVLAEELMSGEQNDYEAVFMSRPKIKTSPVGTPVGPGYEL